MAVSHRRRVGELAEAAVALHLEACGWVILARNMRIGRDELDIVAIEPGDRSAVVVVEVRSGSTARFGAPEESVDAAKVGRLYRAAWAMADGVRLPDGQRVPVASVRVDLVTIVRDDARSPWRVARHLRGLHPP